MRSDDAPDGIDLRIFNTGVQPHAANRTAASRRGIDDARPRRPRQIRVVQHDVCRTRVEPRLEPLNDDAQAAADLVAIEPFVTLRHQSATPSCSCRRPAGP